MIKELGLSPSDEPASSSIEILRSTARQMRSAPGILF
jgi:hypothetical protein